MCWKSRCPNNHIQKSKPYMVIRTSRQPPRPLLLYPTRLYLRSFRLLDLAASILTTWQGQSLASVISRDCYRISKNRANYCLCG